MSMQLLKLLLVAIMLHGIGIAEPQESPDEPAARTLTVSNVRELSVPPFPYYQYPVSDGNHNLYFHYDSGKFDAPVLLKLSPQESAAVMYKLSPEDSEIFLYGSASVTTSGEVWMVCSKEEKGTYLFSFSSDAKPGAPTQLRIQDGFLAKTLVAFPSGTFLVSGYYGHGASKSRQGQSFLGIFDSAGKLIKQLRGIAGNTDVAADILKPADSYAVIGADGNAYFLSSGRITVVSPTGKIVKSIQFEKPEGARGTKIFESNGNLLIQITSVRPNSTHQNRYLLINGYSGESVAIYEPSSELGNIAVDFSANEGLTFIKRDRSKLRLLTAELR